MSPAKQHRRHSVSVLKLALAENVFGGANPMAGKKQQQRQSWHGWQRTRDSRIHVDVYVALEIQRAFFMLSSIQTIDQ